MLKKICQNFKQETIILFFNRELEGLKVTMLIS